MGHEVIQLCHWCGELRGNPPGPRGSRFASRCRQPEWHRWDKTKAPDRMPIAPAYSESEQEVILQIFKNMLQEVTKDGGKKRAAGLKAPWWMDDQHEAGMFSHLGKWKQKVLVDKDSGAHPLVHLAWRALALAYQETYGKVDPESAA